jgi:hypothetical protein
VVIWCHIVVARCKRMKTFVVRRRRGEEGFSNYAMAGFLECRATGYALIEQDFANHYQLLPCPLKTPHTLEGIDGQKISSGHITHIVEAQLSIHEYRERLPMFVTKLGYYPMVLGIPWLKQHNVAIHFALNLITFGSPYCLTYCNGRAEVV